MLLLLLAVTPPSSAYLEIRSQGVSKGFARVLNCSGTGVTCTVDAGGAYATLTVTATTSDGGSSGNWDGGPAIPICDAGYVLKGNGSTLSCVDGIATADISTTANAFTSNPTDCSANQYANTIAANGNLSCSQVDYSQLSGVVPAGGSVPQVQYNADGGLAGIVNVTTDSAHLWITSETSHPTAPGSNALHYNYHPAAEQPPVPMTIDSIMGEPLPVGMMSGPVFNPIGQRALWRCQTHIIDGWASSVVVSTGSSTAVTFALFGNGTASNAFDAGSLLGREMHTTQTTATTLNGQAGARYAGTTTTVWMGNAAHAGGFQSTARVAFTTWPGSHVFCGFWPTLTIVTATVEPSSLTNTIYIGADGTDTNLSACSNDNSGVATCTTLGSNYPKNGGYYEIRLASAPNSQTINWSVERLDTTVAIAHGTMSGDSPQATAIMAWQCTVQNTDAGVAAKLDFVGEEQCANW